MVQRNQNSGDLIMHTSTWDKVNLRSLGTILELVTLACAHLGSLETLNLNAEVSRGPP